METWVLAGWVLASKGDMGVCWPEMDTWVLAGWVLPNNGDAGVCWPKMETLLFCWVGAGQQWRHRCALGGC